MTWLPKSDTEAITIVVYIYIYTHNLTPLFIHNSIHILI